jgi:uncharacterized protein Yka (UPF0111/DUF47 family)
MISIQKLLGKGDKFFNLLEASATQARGSVSSLSKYLAQPEQLIRLDEFIAARRQDKAITTEISDALCTTFVTALEREDIEELSVALYKIPKTVEKIAERITLAPHFLKAVNLNGHLALLEKATEMVWLMIRELRKGVHLERVRALNDQLQAIEGEADKHLLERLRWLYGHAGDSMRAMFLKDIYELLEKVFDRCRDAGNIVNHIVLKNS